MFNICSYKYIFEVKIHLFNNYIINLHPIKRCTGKLKSIVTIYSKKCNNYQNVSYFSTTPIVVGPVF